MLSYILWIHLQQSRTVHPSHNLSLGYYKAPSSHVRLATQHMYREIQVYSREKIRNRIMLPLLAQHTTATKWDCATWQFMKPITSSYCLLPQNRWRTYLWICQYIRAWYFKHTSCLAHKLNIFIFNTYIQHKRLSPTTKMGYEVCSCKKDHHHKILFKHPSFYSKAWEIPSVSPEQDQKKVVSEHYWEVSSSAKTR